MTFQEFFTWLASSGGAAVAFAFITERLSVFQKLSPDHKSLVHLLGSIVLAVAAYAVLTYTPPEVLAQVAPVFNIIAVAFGSWLAGQGAHRLDPKA